MILVESDKERFVCQFSRNEMLLINNALNEVCHGIQIDEREFQTRLGVDLKAAVSLLDQIGKSF